MVLSSSIEVNPGRTVRLTHLRLVCYTLFAFNKPCFRNTPWLKEHADGFNMMIAIVQAPQMLFRCAIFIQLKLGRAEARLDRFASVTVVQKMGTMHLTRLLLFLLPCYLD
jgi:hypothetical protein